MLLKLIQASGCYIVVTHTHKHFLSFLIKRILLAQPTKGFVKKTGASISTNILNDAKRKKKSCTFTLNIEKAYNSVNTVSPVGLD